MAAPRDDVLVSVCILGLPDPEVALPLLGEIAKRIGAAYRFSEFLIVVSAARADAYYELLERIDNIRLLSVVTGTGPDQRRLVAAREAIGDTIFIAPSHELGRVDPLAMLAQAHDENAVILGRRAVSRLVEPVIAALGRASGYRASTGDMQAAAYPRTLLNRLLAAPNPQLALRFPPVDATIRILHHDARVPDLAWQGPSTRGGLVRRRLRLLVRLLGDAAPAVLQIAAAAAALLSAGGALFAIYVVVVFLTVEDVAPGWTTLSFALSLTALFFGLAFFGLCLGLGRLLELTLVRETDPLLGERSKVDLFNAITSDLNVDGPEPPKRPETADDG